MDPRADLQAGGHDKSNRSGVPRRPGSQRPSDSVSQEWIGATVSTVSIEHPNASTYRQTADAFRAGDVDRVAELVASDVIWHVPGSHAMAGDVVGRDAVLEWLAALSGLGFWLREDDVFGNDQHVCAISVMGARRPCVDVQTRAISVFRYRDGQQVERWLYPDDQASWDQIFDG